MAVAKVEGEELKKLVKLGKKRTLSFAFNPGKATDHTLMIDRRKKPEVIAKIAKKDGEGNKVAFGTFVVKSKTMELTCVKVVPAMAKVLKKYLKSQKVHVNILILDEQGNVLDRDEEPLPDDPSWDDGDTAEQAAQAAEPETQSGGETPGDERTALAGRLKQVQPSIAAAVGEAGAKLKKALAAAVTQIKAGDLDGARKTIAALEAALARQVETDTAQAAAPDTPRAPDARALAQRAGALKQVIAAAGGALGESLVSALAAAAQQIRSGDLGAAGTTLDKIEAAARKAGLTARSAQAEQQSENWQAAEARLQPLVDRLMQDRRGDLDAINRVFGFAREQAAAGNHDRALAAAAKLAELIAQAESSEGTAAAAEAREAAPDNIAAYTRSRLNWIDTRAGLRDELGRLKQAIEAATDGIEGLEDVPQSTGVLFEHVEALDSTLEDTLEELVETPDGDRREALKSRARDIIRSYRDTLDSDFFRAVDNNGFVATNIRNSALQSLSQVSAALAA